MKKLLYLCVFLPTFAFSGGMILSSKGTGTIKASKGNGDASMVVFNGYQPPGNFRFTASSSNTLTAQWNAALNPSATGYTLQLSTASDYTGTIISSVTQMTISTLTALSVNVLYYARIKSEYAGSISSVYSSNITTATLSVLPVTLSSTWTVTTTTVTMRWTNGDNPANVTSYTVNLSTVSGFTSGTPVSSTTFMLSSTFTALASGGTYYARVLSTNLSGITSSYLQLGSTNTISAPINFAVAQASCTASVNTSSIVLTFNNSVAAGGFIASMFADTGEGFDLSTDSNGNTYTNWVTPLNSARVTIDVASVTVGGAGLAVTIGATGGNLNGCILEVTGATSVDQSVSSTGSNAAVTTGALTLAQQDLCVGIMSHSSSGTTLTEAGTLVGEDEDNSTHQTYNVQDSLLAAGVNSQTWVAGAVVNYAAAGLCFK